ncbi:MAG: hypothetical protein ACR2IK_25485 [Chloroflexota bacterium]
MARWTLTAVPLALVVASLWWHWKLRSPDALLAGVALLAGSLLAAFGQVASWRERLRDAYRDYEPPPAAVIRQDAIDETATHLLLAAYLSGAEALLIVIGSNVSVDHEGNLTGILAAACIALGAYLMLLFLIAVPRLYDGYVEVNAVRRELSGNEW